MGKPKFKAIHNHLEIKVSALRVENKRLLEQNSALKAELSELKEGIPIEKAKTDGTEYNWHDGEEWRIIYYCQIEPKGWTDGTSREVRNGFYSWTETTFVEPKIVYLIPTQISETKEGS